VEDSLVKTQVWWLPENYLKKEAIHTHIYRTACHLALPVHQPRNQCKHQQLCVDFLARPILLRRRSEKCIAKGSKYAQWIGLYLSFRLSWVLGPFVPGRLHNLKASEDTFGHDLTSLNTYRGVHIKSTASRKL